MKKIKKYKLGSYIEPMGNKGQAFGMGANLLGSAIGGEGGNFISGVASGAMAGGPLGAVLGGLGATIGNITQQNRLAKEERARQKAFTTNYHDQLMSDQDTLNENPYGQVYADGGVIQDPINSSGKKRRDIIKPIEDKILTAWLKTEKEGKVPSREIQEVMTKYMLGMDGGNPPPMDPTIQKMQGVISKLPTDKVSELLGTDWNNVNVVQGLKKAKDAGVGLLDAMKYYNHFMGLKKKGYTFADGGLIPDVTQINIEKGELQIDPSTGKILREFNGINPETGGLYKPHSKGKDTNNNFVTAEPGTFIITSKKAKDYKTAVEENDKLRQNTILQNITNYKDSKIANSDKFALGSYVDPPALLQRPQPYNWQGGINMAMDGLQPGYLAPAQTAPKLGSNYNSQLNVPNIPTGIAGVQGGGVQGNSIMDKIGSGIGTYGNALYNIGQGIFGKVDTIPQVQATKNPYKSQILNNMPQDISLEPARQQLLRQQDTAFNQIDNTTSGSPIARANKLNVVANTQNQLGMLAMQNQINNNQVRTQRAGMYGNLGAQEMNETNRVQQLNLGIDEQNRANKGAKQNMLSTGLTQLQQAYQNNRTNNSKAAMDKYKVDLLRQMFPNLKYYGAQFDYDNI